MFSSDANLAFFPLWMEQNKSFCNSQSWIYAWHNVAVALHIVFVCAPFPMILAFIINGSFNLSILKSPPVVLDFYTIWNLVFYFLYFALLQHIDRMHCGGFKRGQVSVSISHIDTLTIYRATSMLAPLIIANQTLLAATYFLFVFNNWYLSRKTSKRGKIKCQKCNTISI